MTVNIKFDMYYQFLLSTKYHGDDDKHIKWSYNIIKYGTATDLYKIGCQYYDGVNVTMNYNRAYSLFERSSKLNNVNASYMLGICYLFGFGTEIDIKKGLSLIISASDRECDSASIFMGNCYMHGDFVEKDQYTAISWWRLAADRGNNLAINLIDENSLWEYGKPIELQLNQ